MTETRTLPHDPYITAVHDALYAVGLEPSTFWTSDAEIDPYATGDDAGCTTMLSAVLRWDADEHDDGLFLFWDHPAGQWQYAYPRPEGGNTAPEYLPHLGLYCFPGAVAATVARLLAGQPMPDEPAPSWRAADSIRADVEAWAAPTP